MGVSKNRGLRAVPAENCESFPWRARAMAPLPGGFEKTLFLGQAPYNMSLRSIQIAGANGGPGCAMARIFFAEASDDSI
jgi:hypothetical protein